MTTSAASFLTLFFGIFLIFLWLHQTKAKEIASHVAKDLCERSSAQLLDASVHLQKFRITRPRHGGLSVIREYYFEYSRDGVSRHRGRVILKGYKPMGARLDDAPIDGLERGLEWGLDLIDPAEARQKKTPAKIISFRDFQHQKKKPSNSDFS